MGSSIVEQCGNDIEKMFLLLYEKYIDWNHSSFEINISHAVRQKMHDLYVRITYQLLVDERRIILMEQRIGRESMNGANGHTHHKTTGDQMDGDVNGTNEKLTGSGLWHSRKSVVNTLKATISTKHVDSDQSQGQMGTVVHSEKLSRL